MTHQTPNMKHTLPAPINLSSQYETTHCIESTLANYDFVEESPNTPDIHLIIIMLYGGGGGYVICSVRSGGWGKGGQWGDEEKGCDTDLSRIEDTA